ncbi:DUF2529 family protein [Bacillus sp. SM2101]|uniref:DUF2529 family protein n=1 Tax=Bacillus sp. SM2101 TaxID=2805366 RepID=UPI001BDEB343|nr:DUF2529 family protein [Bacillus sp. SM2101]
MLKIFTTQLSGIFTKIINNEEFQIEDGARLLAQAKFGDGSIYLHGVNEMEAISIESSIGAEPLLHIKELPSINHFNSLNETDRVLLITRFSTDEAAINIALALRKRGIPTVAICNVATPDNDEITLSNIADIVIDTKLAKPLITNSDGTRFGFPTTMIALFTYHALAYTMQEILDEY